MVGRAGSANLAAILRQGEEPSVRDPWLIAEYSREDIDRNCVFERRVEREG
jgi:hypothetical protein